MADIQGEFGLPTPDDDKRQSARFLPRFFRSEANQKFLQSTVDQLIQPGVAEKISGYFGRKVAKSFLSTDNYIGDPASKDRENYQLEPATVIKDSLDNVTFYKDYNDYINQLKYYNVDTSNHSNINAQVSYPWNPNIDWDKFVNFREYYWLPDGPNSVAVQGQSREVQSTYTITVDDADGDASFQFNTKLERNPTLRLYRGQKYTFEIDTEGHPLAFALTKSFKPGEAVVVATTEGIKDDGKFGVDLFGSTYDTGDWLVLPNEGSVTFEDDESVSTLYPDGIRKLGENGEEVANVYLEKGKIEFTIPFNSPDRLYYISKNDINVSGVIRIYDIEENTFLDVEDDIIGTRKYTSANGIEFTNGLKVNFRGQTSPEKYAEGNYYVEGVGSAIKLVPQESLNVIQTNSTDRPLDFDKNDFDELPFDNAENYSTTKDYIVIGRQSIDGNSWSRANRWFHKTVLQKTNEYNHSNEAIDESGKAKRPIIEFEPGLRLFKFGTKIKKDVDLIDTFTTDVFSEVEGSLGYNIDGVNIVEGMRIIFTKDTDKLVKDKIFEVKKVKIDNDVLITLIESEDTAPLLDENVLIKSGSNNKGIVYYYNGTDWIKTQQKTKTNQQPLFCLYDADGKYYGDLELFNSSTFQGTKIFSYKEGRGTEDPELGFPLTYRNIENSGDIVFDFNLLTDTFSYEDGESVVTLSTDTSFLKKYSALDKFEYANGWSSTPMETRQKVVRHYIATLNAANNFAIDVYNAPGDLNDLVVSVFVNNNIQKEITDYTIYRQDSKATVIFTNDLNENDSVVIKTTSAADKNDNGFYEIPLNLEKNPLNEEITSFTFGEVADQVLSMVEDLQEFDGVFPGNSNLRDLGDIDKFGKRFIKHTGPLNLPLYHLTSKKFNIVNAIEYNAKEYEKFKREVINTATNLGFDGETKLHLDKVLQETNKDKTETQPFYFSDMLGYNTTNKIVHTIFDKDDKFYGLSKKFNLSNLSEKSVNVYLNGKQLIYNLDYNFTDEGFINLDSVQQTGDILEIYEYDNTDGAFVPPTPTKLGMYPRYHPEITIDDTFVNDDEINTTLAYTCYGQLENNHTTQGWFYPLYIDRSTARDADANGEVETIKLNGLPVYFYAPKSLVKKGVAPNTDYEEYPVIALIRGHDGSFIRAYKDFRDNLLLDFEKRIYNNIKIDYTKTLVNIHNFISGSYRNSYINSDKVNDILLKDFIQWMQGSNISDYTKNDFYNVDNTFTYNYSTSVNQNGKSVEGFWRGVYINAYDTDRPHTHPWEMLGFSIKPEWWETQYGASPYTSDNIVLWKDLETGTIKDPNGTKINPLYARPGLLNFVPVDSQGKLKSPAESGHIENIVFRDLGKPFKFGDHSPVETAWRRSSSYCFALVKAMLLNKPAHFMSMAFDTSRTVKNNANQNVYLSTQKQVNLASLSLPNTVNQNSRVFTSGLVNFVHNLIGSNVYALYDDYQYDLKNINNQLGFKLAGFTDKDKLSIILDSKSPTNDQPSGIFIPQENYDVFLNTSSPIDVIVYSGVIIEKATDGYIVKGYNFNNPNFKYFKPLTRQGDREFTFGGDPEPSTDWTENKKYIKGQVVKYKNEYYRVSSNYTSDSVFDTNVHFKLDNLPVNGGKSVVIKSTFETKISNLNYGTKLTSTQEVCDFLLGYQEYLKSTGFTFDYFNDKFNTIENWNNALQEFVIWTSEGWASGTILSLSPGAYALEFKKDFAVVDDIYDEFYDYSLLSEQGLPLRQKFSSILRDNNSFSLKTKNTDSGIYNLALPLVQKEHVVIIDNETVFNDKIYQPRTGYRQERLKVLGYRSDNWLGGLNIPGFIYDDTHVTEWTRWQDYNIGSVVKYKEYYYVANNEVAGSYNFEFTNWVRLNEKPESKLIANFEYKINQFADFYDLDTDNFDLEQQKMAQHLIGYQKREYLSNIIQDDVSQYKFYQGYIQDKGTMNALDKLFNSIRGQGLEFYEEWALQVGKYGSTDNIKQIEIPITQSNLRESPQSIEFVEYLPEETFDKTYRVRPFDLLDKPQDFNVNTFPTTTNKEYILSGGYVHEDDIDFKTAAITDLKDVDINQMNIEQYIWVTFENPNNWNVYQIIDLEVNSASLSVFATPDESNQYYATITLTENQGFNLESGDYVAIVGAQLYNVFSFYEVISYIDNQIFIRVSEDNNIIDFDSENFDIYTIKKVRASNFEEFNTIARESKFESQRVWIDNYAGENRWAVLENTPSYKVLGSIVNPEDPEDSTNLEVFTDYASDFAISSNNKDLFLSSPESGNGKVFYYTRNREDTAHEFVQTFTSLELPFSTENAKYGKSVSVSDDGEFLAIGIPGASQIKTKYKGDYVSNVLYSKRDIVKYKESLWRANRNIVQEGTTQTFETYDSYINIESRIDQDSTNLTLLSQAYPGLGSTSGNDHILVRAPLAQHIATTTGDYIRLKWNELSYVNGSLTSVYKPWNDTLSTFGISTDFVSGWHRIQEKITRIIIINDYLRTVDTGDIVQSSTGSATVAKVKATSTDLMIYLKDEKGTFDTTDFLNLYDFANDLTAPIGTYTEVTLGETSEEFGLWLIDSPVYTSTNTPFETGKGLVYLDVLEASNYNAGTQTRIDYVNVLDTVNSIGEVNLARDRVNIIDQLTYNDPDNGIVLSDKWIVRVPTNLSNSVSSNLVGIGSSSNPSYEFYMYNYENAIDVSASGITHAITNKTQTVYDVWDGYIDIDFSGYTNFEGTIYGLKVGDVIQDVQRPLDINGQPSTNPTPTDHEATIVYIKRNTGVDFQKVRVYIKINSGLWDLEPNIAQVQILRLAGTTTDGTVREVNRLIGEINDFNADTVVPSGDAGKFLVFEADNDFAYSQYSEIFDQEYYFYTVLTQTLASEITASAPSSLNLDWSQIYHIETNEAGNPSLNGVGAVAIYSKSGINNYVLNQVLVSEFNFNVLNENFGKKVKILNSNNGYKLCVSSKGSGTEENSGIITFFEHGPIDVTNYRGKYNSNENYVIGETVSYEGRYYRARTTLTSDNNIDDSNSWEDISWRRTTDEKYRGTIAINSEYGKGSVVLYNNGLYKAKTNIITSATIGDLSTDASWTAVDNNVEYIGYIPWITSSLITGDAQFDNTDIVLFSDDFIVSENANILITKISQTGNSIALVVYVLDNGRYRYQQTIDDTDGNVGFATSFKLNPQGNKLAVSRTLDGIGSVHIYNFVSGQFDVNNPQIITPPSVFTTKKFGYTLSFGEENLAIGSLDARVFIDDSTDFIVNGIFTPEVYDQGVVYYYEEVNNNLIFAERITYGVIDDNAEQNVKINGNHLYIGASAQDNNQYQGEFFNYRKTYDAKTWTVTRQISDPVDIKKIKSAFLYNKTRDEIVSYLDFIDPIQGKIAGPAEKNITYKTPYDPASYNVGDAADTVFWSDEHVGKIWWDISKCKFTYPYQKSIQYQKDNWNELQPDASVDVYEWVESVYLPSTWDELSNLPEGSTLGISGTTLYGDTQFSKRFIYDNDSQTFSEIYYYWVRNKNSVPKTDTNRTISALDIARLIATPREQGYRFISFLSSNGISLNNCDSLITNDDIVLNIRYHIQDNRDQNEHDVYQILSDGLKNSAPHPIIETKWFDSLIGFDKSDRTIPDPALLEKNRYGIQNNPRQGMFKNRVEALKNLVDRVNIVLENNNIVDNIDMQRLNLVDELPTINSGLFDVTFNNETELTSINSKIKTPILKPVITNGKITNVQILDPGRGYKVPPTYTINGIGQDANFEIEINNLGQITRVNLTNNGSNYDNNTSITVRAYSALVITDNTLSDNSWAIYRYNSTEETWQKTRVQSYSVPRYWQYIDWYAAGYNALSKVDHYIKGTYQIEGTNAKLGQIIKVENVGTGGWLLLKRKSTTDNEDFTQVYDTIGRQNGTIKLLPSLYGVNSSTGFDNRSFDNFSFDKDPRIELRIILEAIRDDIFVGNLQNEYNQLFISSLRYILNEQRSVDWFFKTSFVKVKHHASTLEQDITFNVDNLDNYKSYIEEVKPFKTVLREFISNHTKTEETNTSVTDFDLPTYYDDIKEKIVPNNVKITNGEIVTTDDNITEYPRRNWLDNVGFEITDIKITNSGTEYTTKPAVEVIGGGGSGAVIEAFIGYGNITGLKIVYPGEGYTSIPTIQIAPPPNSEGVQATAYPVLGRSKPRTIRSTIKFDRNWPVLTQSVNTLEHTQSFTGTGTQTVFDLEWPMQVLNSTYVVYINNTEVLSGQYSVTNIQDMSKGYTRYKGRVVLSTPAGVGDTVTIVYNKSLEILNAIDRIKFAYNPNDNMISKDAAQLMDGIDYAGVQIDTLDFGTARGWGNGEWTDFDYDTDEELEDLIVELDGSSTSIILPRALELDVSYNIYRIGIDSNDNIFSNIRHDDENFGTAQQSNLNATCQTLVGDGETQVINLNDLGIMTAIREGESYVKIVVRKVTSDGSILPYGATYDTDISGGDLNYLNASGQRPEDIIIDGDNFVTPESAKSVEELVPGQVQDTLDMQVTTKGEDSAVYSYRIFKDITNNTTYKRIDSPTTKLSKELTQYDLQIEVKDATNLPEPDRELNLPGVLWIGKERIEYLVKDENRLRLIRRGTLGTGVRDVHPLGTPVYDQSRTKNITYEDVTQTQTVDSADVSSVASTFELGFIPNSVDEFEIFINGIRLTGKTSKLYNPNIAQDSPEGDEDVAADFTLSYVIENDTPVQAIIDITNSSLLEFATRNIVVTRKKGSMWNVIGESITETETSIGFFLRSGN